MKWFLVAVMLVSSPTEDDTFIFEPSFKDKTECTTFAFENRLRIFQTLYKNFNGADMKFMACVDENTLNQIIGIDT